MTSDFPGRYEALPWYRKRADSRWGPPDDELGALLPARLLAAATPKANVLVCDLIAYSTGFEFMVTVRYSTSDPYVEPMGSERYYVEGGEIDRCLRFGLEYSDGFRMTNLDRVAGLLSQRPDDAQRLTQVWGGGGGEEEWRKFEYRWWVNGWPPDGPVRFGVEWPVADIPFAKLDFADGGAIRAAGHAQTKLWA